MQTDLPDGSVDLSYDHNAALIHTAWLTIVLVAVVVVAHVAIHSENPFSGLMSRVGIPWIVPVLFGSIVAHELLHGLTAMVFGGLQRADITFGVNWKMLMPYAHPKGPMAARAYGVMAAAPGVILGVVPALIGLTTGSGPWTAYGALMLAGAGGDLMILFSLRHTPGSTLVQDHPVRVGCYVPAQRSAE